MIQIFSWINSGPQVLTESINFELNWVRGVARGTDKPQHPSSLKCKLLSSSKSYTSASLRLLPTKAQLQPPHARKQRDDGDSWTRLTIKLQLKAPNKACKHYNDSSDESLSWQHCVAERADWTQLRWPTRVTGLSTLVAVLKGFGRMPIGQTLTDFKAQ